MRLLSIFIILASTLAYSQEKLSVEKIWKDYLFFGKSVQGFNGTQDGEHFTQFSEIDGKSVISKHKILDHQAKGNTIVDLSTLSINIDDYSFNADESKMLFTTNTKSIYRHSYTAIYYLYDLNTKKLQPLDNDHSPQTLAKYSPDGNFVSYIFENNIYVKDILSNEITQLTFDGARNSIINGTTDWVNEEEFGYTDAYAWSPDSKSIAFLKFDESNVKEFNLEYFGGLYPDLYTFKYPKAGEDNSIIKAYITSIKNPKPVALNLDQYEYIPRLKWSSIENTLILLTLNRHQNHLKYYKVNWDGKTGNSSMFYEEIDEAYVEIDNNLLVLKDGKTILRTSESNGYNHIYAVDFNGESRQITKGNWDVIEFYGIDDKNEYIYYSAAKKGAINKGIYRIKIDGKKDMSISDEIGQADAQFTKGMNYFILSHSTANTPPTHSLCNKKGEKIVTLENNFSLKERLSEYQLSKKEFTTFELEGRTLNVWMIKPANFDTSKKYPIYVAIYGGPGANTVSNGWEGTSYMYHQLLAQEGYIVVSVDPRGTMYQGSKFKKSTYLNLGKLETEDFIDVAKKLGELSYVDKSRIGIQGWSYGGFMTSLCMTKGADYFKMGIAVAPVTNWRYYDNIYTERFMRTPQENESGYDDNSPINHVSKLKGKYFLIHGSGDDNVHHQNSMDMISALVKANKQFDLFIYPNKNHGIYGGNTRNHLFNMMFNYTKENL